MKNKVFLVSPEAPEPPAAKVEEGVQLSAKAGGLRLGILENGKGNSDHLLRFVADRLQKAVPVDSLVWVRKHSMSHPAEEEMYAKLAAETDFVVSAIAD
jgi:hypothetical protein